MPEGELAEAVDPETLHCHVTTAGDPGAPSCSGETHCTCNCAGCLQAHQVAALWYARKQQAVLSAAPPALVVHLSCWAQQPEVRIHCTHKGTTPAWKPRDPSLPPKVYESDDHGLYTFTPELVTCVACKETPYTREGCGF